MMWMGTAAELSSPHGHSTPTTLGPLSPLIHFETRTVTKPSEPALLSATQTSSKHIAAACNSAHRKASSEAACLTASSGTSVQNPSKSWQVSDFRQEASTSIMVQERVLYRQQACSNTLRTVPSPASTSCSYSQDAYRLWKQYNVNPYLSHWQSLETCLRIVRNTYRDNPTSVSFTSDGQDKLFNSGEPTWQADSGLRCSNFTER